MLLLFIFIHIAQTTSRQGSLDKGIFFNEETKILLVEKFINVQFLIPFPRFEMTLISNVDQIAQSLQNMWQTPTYFCYLNFTNTSEVDFKMDWLLRETQKEISFAQNDLLKIKGDVASFLKGTQENKSTRKKRALPLAAAAVGAIGLFGGGIMFGSGDCGIMGIFGSCQAKAKQNARNIEKLGEYAISLGENIQQLANSTDAKFFRVSKELEMLHGIQRQIIETQNQNWRAIEKQFNTFQQNIHEMRNCDQLLYTRQQVNFNFDTISSLLSLIYSNVKSYRAALYAFQMNIMNAIPSLLTQYVPMSLLPKESLEIILQQVATEQLQSRDRLTLAIPLDELLAYYEARLLLDVLTLDDGLLMTMSIPLASRQTVFTVYKAIVVPMPQLETEYAIQWTVETEYIAISEDLRETALVTRDQLGKCIGSNKYKICHETMATETSDASCLAVLYFGNVMDAIEVCDTEAVTLPLKEKATNLGYGIWLITSTSSNFKFRESYMNATTTAGSTMIDGCRICLVSLSCGKQLIGPNVRIRSDLSTCMKVPPLKLNVTLPEPMARLFSLIPTVDQLPHYNTRVEANIQLLSSLKLELQSQPDNSYRSDLNYIAQPIAQKLTALKPSLEKQFNNYLSWKSHLAIGLVVFFVSTALHLGVTYALHRYKRLHKFLPFSHKLDNQKVSLKPIMMVEDHYLEGLENDEKFPWRNNSLLIPESQLKETRNPEPDAPIYSQLNRQLRTGHI